MASDRISTFLGAPPHKWKLGEVNQIKQIHLCYRRALNAVAEEDEVQIYDLNGDNDFALHFSGTLAARVAPPPITKQTAQEKSKAAPKAKEPKAKDPKAKDAKAKDAKADDAVNEADLEEDDDTQAKDEEWFLPKDSPLRSKDCEKKAPLNSTFKDYSTFLNSCSFDYWREHFEQQSSDRLLSETAEALVANVCTLQSQNQLRVKNGNIPLRKKREHITPLALVLHELKLWATHFLRTASVFEKETFLDIKCRVAYLEGLTHKEVWGDSVLIISAGMTSLAHETLFRLLLNLKESLTRAQLYAFRGFCRRSSREKLSKLQNLLKDILLREMKILSCRAVLTKKLSNPKTNRLQTVDLLNKVENMSFVDFKNYVNVMMYKLCQLPLVKAALTSDYENEVVKKEVRGNKLSEWKSSNLFCLPNESEKDNELEIKEPVFLMDERKGVKIMPKIYQPTANELTLELKEKDPRAALPLTAKKHVKILTEAYESEGNALVIVKQIMKVAASLQDLTPNLFVLHTLWGIAGDGGDFTVYDTLRKEVMDIMASTIEKIYFIQTTSKALHKTITKMSKEKEIAMEKQRVKTGKARYKPAWVMNHKWINNELMKASDRAFSEVLKSLWEVAKDASEYNLSSEELSDKVRNAKELVAAVTGNSENIEDVPSAEKVEKVEKAEKVEVKKEDIKVFENKEVDFEYKNIARNKSKDWLFSNIESGNNEFGKNDMFGENKEDKENDEFFKFDEENADSSEDESNTKRSNKPKGKKYNPFEDEDDETEEN